MSRLSKKLRDMPTSGCAWEPKGNENQRKCYFWRSVITGGGRHSSIRIHHDLYDIPGNYKTQRKYYI